MFIHFYEKAYKEQRKPIELREELKWEKKKKLKISGKKLYGKTIAPKVNWLQPIIIMIVPKHWPVNFQL